MAEAERLRKAEEAERIRREEIEKKRKEMILEKQRLQDQLDTKRHKRDQLQQEKDAQEAKQADTKKRLDEISMRLQVMIIVEIYLFTHGLNVVGKCTSSGTSRT